MILLLKVGDGQILTSVWHADVYAPTSTLLLKTSNGTIGLTIGMAELLSMIRSAFDQGFPVLDLSRCCESPTVTIDKLSGRPPPAAGKH